MDQDNQSSSGISAALARRLQHAVRLAQTADDMFDETVVEFLGVSRSDGRCLDIVDRLGRCTAGRLAAESGLTTGAVTALVDRMERAGYLRRVRDTADRRKVWIETTEATRAIIERIFGHYAALGPNVLATFAPDQVAAIVRFLEGGSIIQRHMADILKQHTDPRSKDLTERLIQARAFERAAISSAPDLVATIRNLPPLESE